MQVAQNNLMPLQNNVETQQAAYDAENQQYLLLTLSCARRFEI
jgi:hypothetical protein